MLYCLAGFAAVCASTRAPKKISNKDIVNVLFTGAPLIPVSIRLCLQFGQTLLLDES